MLEIGVNVITLDILYSIGLSDWANIATIIGLIIATAALIYTAIQINQNTKISRGQFWLELEKMFSNHDDVHLYLRPGGKWAKEGKGPKTAKDWAKVEDYMGLFEHCEIMLQKKLIDEATFKAIFSYRLSNIMANKIIVNSKLVNKREDWSNFIRLLKEGWTSQEWIRSGSGLVPKKRNQLNDWFRSRIYFEGLSCCRSRWNKRRLMSV